MVFLGLEPGRLHIIHIYIHTHAHIAYIAYIYISSMYVCVYIYVYQVGSVLIGFVPLIFVPLNWCLINPKPV